MAKLNFDTGAEEFVLPGGGALRFNPTDPGLFRRFEAFCSELDGWLAETPAADETAGALARAEELDARIKERLGGVFGPGNDMDTALSGISLLALTASGTTVLENLMDALAPVMEQSAAEREKQLREKAGAAKAKAAKARGARGGK